MFNSNFTLSIQNCTDTCSILDPSAKSLRFYVETTIRDFHVYFLCKMINIIISFRKYNFVELKVRQSWSRSHANNIWKLCDLFNYQVHLGCTVKIKKKFWHRRWLFLTSSVRLFRTNRHLQENRNIRINETITFILTVGNYNKKIYLAASV